MEQAHRERVPSFHLFGFPPVVGYICRTMSRAPHSSPPLKHYAVLSISAALVTIGLKTLAYLVTGSVGLLSDAAESLVNLVGAVLAFTMLSIAARPADDNHAYGHGKAEYFSSGVEGTMILLAGIGIGATAINRLASPHVLQQLGTGIVISAAASLVNLATSLLLLRAGRRYRSITLEANARHLLADVWTTAGVITGIAVVSFSGWQRLDPIIALIVTAVIIRTGILIVRKSILGLMDTALPAEEQATLTAILESYRKEGIDYHALRTRQAGPRRFISLHVIVPGTWTVHEGHSLLERIEADIRSAFSNVTVLTHLESSEDPSSWDDVALDRTPGT